MTWQDVPWREMIAIGGVGSLLVWLVAASRGTRALRILFGVTAILCAMLLGEWLDLYPNHWEVTHYWPEVVLAYIILFQPELRRVLAHIGRNPFRRGSESESTRVVEELVKAALSMANRRIGALLVIEREQELLDAVEVGTVIDARISKELLISLFLPYSPLHDGAVIVRAQRIVAAGCFLPLTGRTDGIETYGTRHRAALGITEETDAIAIAVSEETGSMSLVVGGEIRRDLDGPSLRQQLFTVLGVSEPARARRTWLDRVRS